jgi:hypothetical protein
MVRRSAKSNADTGLLRHLPKWQVTTNLRWMHLGAGETSILYTIQEMMAMTMQHFITFGLTPPRLDVYLANELP